MGNKKVNVTADVSGITAVQNLVNMISNVRSKTVDVVTRVFKQGSATGSFADSPYIPEHAAGYIAAGPTLTNNGWVGEDGTEAVLNWATGGAVIPLTNTRYMRPIASAIADEMDGSASGGGRDDRPNVSIGNISVSPESKLYELLMELGETIVEDQRRAGRKAVLA